MLRTTVAAATPVLPVKGPKVSPVHLYSSTVSGHRWTGWQSMCWAHFPVPAEGTGMCWSPSTTSQSGWKHTPYLTKKLQPWPKPWCKECSAALEHPRSSTLIKGGILNHMYSPPCVANLASGRK